MGAAGLIRSLEAGHSELKTPYPTATLQYPHLSICSGGATKKQVNWLHCAQSQVQDCHSRLKDNTEKSN